MALNRASRAGLEGWWRLSGPVEGIAEGDLLDVLHVRIIERFRIDEIEHRHGHLLTRLQRLLGEAEALDLVEVLAGLLGFDVEAGGAGHRHRRVVLRLVDRHVALAELNGVGNLPRAELPRHVAGDVGVEADRYSRGAAAERRGPRRVGLGRDLGGAGEAGDTAEQVV